MRIIYLFLISVIMASGEYILYDFNSVQTSGKWQIINDRVMGGVSESNIQLNSDGTATFKGTVSPENNGGFASIRSPLSTNPDSGFKGVIIRLKGDGKIYSIRFRTDNNFDGYAYQAKVQTKKDAWEEFKIPFNEFSPTFRGVELSNKPALESQNIAQVGMLIADKQWGDFTLEIDWIKFYD